MGHFDLLQKKLDALFNENKQTRPSKDFVFEPSHDPNTVRNLSVGLSGDPLQRSVQIFCRLAFLFECGFMLEKENEVGIPDTWTPRAFFQNGQAQPLHHTSEKPGLSQQIVLPKTAPLEALKNSADSILKTFGKEHFNLDKKLHAYLLQPTPELAFIVFSGLPDLWLRDHLQLVVQKLADACAP